MERDEMIKECKRIIAIWGSVTTMEMELDSSPCIRSIDNVSDLVETFNYEGVKVVVYYSETLVGEYHLLYEELSIETLTEVWNILFVYDKNKEEYSECEW